MKIQSIKSHHLVIILVIVMTIVTGLLLIGLNKTTEKEIVKKYNEEQLHLVKDLSRSIEKYINVRVELVDLLSSLLSFKKYGPKFVSTEINHFYENEKRNFATKFNLYDKTGTVIYSSNKDIIGHKLSESEIFLWAKNPENKGKQFISPPINVPKVKGDSIPHLHFVIAAPIYNAANINDKLDSSQKFAGVVTETVDFDKLLRVLISNHQSDKVKEYLWIMEKNGTLLFHADHPEMAFANVQKQNESCMNCHISFKHLDAMLIKKEGNIEYQLKNRPLKLASYTTLDYKNISWIVVLNTPSEEIGSFIHENILQSYLLLGMIALTFFTISFLIYRSFKLRVKAEEESKQLREKSILKEKIEESEKRYRNLVESSPDAIAVHCNGILVYVNEAGAELIGATKPEDLIGKPILEFVHPNYHEQVKKQVAEVLRTNKHSSLLEEKLIRLDGRHVDVEFTAIPTIYDGNQAIQIIIRDITDRRLTEEALRNRESYLSAIIENQPGLMWLKDRESKLLAVNNAFAISCSMQTPNDVVGKTDLDIWPRELAEKYRIDDIHIMKTGKTISIEELINEKGKDKWFETFKTPVKDINGKIIGTTGYAHDITERKIVQLELIKAKERAEESDKLKSEFLAQISHEIRTPLNAVVGNVEYLNDFFGEHMDSDSRNCFEGIDLASKRIIRTVDLVLNVAELQTSGYKPYLTNINLDSEVLQKLFKEHQLSAKHKELEFIYSCRVNDADIMADNYSIIQIFANLIDNAIKYTKKGKVEIQLEKNANNKIMVEIKDTGVGVSKEFLPKLFDPFLQEDTGYTRSYDGSGLGLTLVKNYCEINNATIEVESEKNVGSTFRVTFNN